MSVRDIPVRVVGPGSQDGGQTPAYIDMPGDMTRFAMPLIPEPDAVAHLDGAREAMQWLRGALRAWEPGSEPQLANLAGLDEENRELVNQVLGEGEVSITCDGEVVARCQESVLAGVWRSLYFNDEGKVFADLLEVAPVPHLVAVLSPDAGPVDLAPPDGAAELANAMPVLVEVDAHVESFANGGERHAINLSLLPLSPAELEFLDERLGRGPVDILSRAYGKCEVISTRTPTVWWVRYFNSMGTPILNSLEIGDVPDVVAAAPEDLHDSATRLGEIIAPYWGDPDDA